MAARTKSKVTPKFKTEYRVKNCPAYEAARSRKPTAQAREAMIAVNVINRMTGLGQPVSVPVAM